MTINLQFISVYNDCVYFAMTDYTVKYLYNPLAKNGSRVSNCYYYEQSNTTYTQVKNLNLINDFISIPGEFNASVQKQLPEDYDELNYNVRCELFAKAKIELVTIYHLKQTYTVQVYENLAQYNNELYRSKLQPI